MTPQILAKPYAKALFMYAKSSNNIDKWQIFLAILSLILSEKKMQNYLCLPSLNSLERKKIIVNILNKLSEDVDSRCEKFIEILIDNKRLNITSAIVDIFNKMIAKDSNTTKILVTSAYPFDSDQHKKLLDNLSKFYNCRVDIESKVDNNLIGGIVIKKDDQVIDNSIICKLNKFSEFIRN